MPTKIEWCDETFNPWWGCERVSPGCAHCYAATFSRRLGMDHLWPRRRSVQNGQQHGFRFFGDEHWAQPLKWARTLPAKLGRRPRVFCASMADVFEERPELNEHRVALYDLILRTPELDWLILTKRPEFARDWLADHGWRSAIAFAHARHFEDGDGAWDWVATQMARGPENVWLGVSIETSRQTYRADVLREIPAAVRFISAEPLLGSLFKQASWPGRVEQHAIPTRPLDLTGIDWLIIGGESGQGARPFHLAYARELIRVCRWARSEWRIEHEGQTVHSGHTAPAIFVKQLGADPRAEHVWKDGAPAHISLRDAKGGDPDEWPPDLRIREWPSVVSHRVPGAA